MYEKVDNNLNFPAREKTMEKFWQDNNIFQKSIDQREGSDTFVFYDGPPTANGKPHIGHILTRVIKDMIPRYQTMKGHKSLRKAGWDTHGLPVELEIEKELGLDGKEQIEKYGIEPFVNKCRSSVWKYKGMWEEFSRTVGYWADMDNPYITYDNNYIESVWWALKQIWEKGLLYKGHKIVPYCPRCGTPLSSHEVAQGYKDVTERSAIARFKVKDEDAYFLVWTTTPWTLPSNIALCVNPDIDYVKAISGDYTYYLAKALVEKVLGEDYKIVAELKGKELEFKEYEPLYPYAVGKSKKKSFFVACDGYVTCDDGTGIVHLAPAFGEDDSRVCHKYDTAFVQFVDSKGCLTDDTDFAGVFIKKADNLILKDLKNRGLLFDAPQFKHSYPHCWRCDTPLIYYARESWFVKMTAVKEDLLKNNAQVNWIPPTIGKGRFGDWLEHVQDWGISRNRYWGTPLNIWECECGHRHAIDSIEELRKLAPTCPQDIELHRPFIDAITFACPECGKQMHRVPEVIDCWFDSGSMPFAQWHYPFENQELFHKSFPADFISEAVDQTRGWFYSLLAVSTLIFNKPAYKNVIVLGHVQDKNGQKMSKSKGNAVEPMAALKQHGADAIRWYFYENSAPWLPNRFHDDAVREGQRKFLGTLWNTYAFYVLYANIDGFTPKNHTLDYDNLTVMDKWIISRLNTLILTVDNNLQNYRITETAKTLQKFIDELSNWYVRRSRERFWGKGLSADKINAYMTLYTCLATFIKLAAPMIPFMTDIIYQNLVRNSYENVPESVHLCQFPQANEKFIDKDLEEKMELTLEIVTLGRAARNASNIKNRQPIGTMYAKVPVELSSYYQKIASNELNVKKLIFCDDMSEYLSYIIKPNFKVLGPKASKKIGAIKAALLKLDGAAAKEALSQDGHLSISLPEGSFELAPEDIEITTQQKDNFAAQSYNKVTVALDTRLSPALIEEGFVREIISKIQTMRKENNFEVTDRIKVSFTGNEKIASLAEKNAEEIKKIVLADELFVTALTNPKASKEWNINGENVTIAIA